MEFEAFAAEAARRGLTLADPREAWGKAEATGRELRGIPLLPRNGLYLQPRHAGDEARFARLFRETWPRLPLAARRLLVKFWREKSPDAYFLAGIPAPSIEVLCDWSARGRHGEGVVGTWFPYRFALWFWAPAVDLLPDELLRTLIAHEMGHAWWDAMGWREEGDCSGDDPIEESYVRDMVQDEWGFDEDTLTEWLQANEARVQAECEQRDGEAHRQTQERLKQCHAGR